MAASRPFRKSDRSEESQRFFASCCVIVEAPCLHLPFPAGDLPVPPGRFADGLPVDPPVLEEARVLGGDDGLDEGGRDVAEGNGAPVDGVALSGRAKRRLPRPDEGRRPRHAPPEGHDRRKRHEPERPRESERGREKSAGTLQPTVSARAARSLWTPRSASSFVSMRCGRRRMAFAPEASPITLLPEPRREDVVAGLCRADRTR